MFFSENHAPTPLEAIIDEHTTKAKVKLFVKRDDLIHPSVSGNKFRKLKFNLLEAKKLGKDTLLTFGGAFSNHIHATASAGKLMGFKTIGIIRGEEHLPLNPTLAYATEQGMQLHYIDRTSYRQKAEPAFIEQLKAQFGDFYLIPEGGTNALALKGVAELPAEIDIPHDYICCATGTGGTTAGIISTAKATVLGFSALKGNFLQKDVQKLLGRPYPNWAMVNDYHFGGYAKKKPELEEFIDWFNTTHNIPLEWIYTGKMMFGVYDLMKKEFFREGSNIVAVHTGGLQAVGKKV